MKEQLQLTEPKGGSHGFALSLSRLRLVSIVAPVAFLAAVEALSIFSFAVFVPGAVVRFLLSFGLITIGAVPFAVWVFRVIERQERDAAQSALLVDSVEDHAIFMLDPAGRILTWNKGGERVKGFRSDEVLGRSFAMLYPPEDVAAGFPQRNLERAEQSGSTEYEGWRVRKDGSRFWANVVLTVVRDNAGNLVGYSVVTRDITQRMQEQQQIEHLNDELGDRVRELGEANAQVQRRNRQLTAANQSIVAISSALDPSEVLQRIVDSARDLVDAKYGALGVAATSGAIQQFITTGMSDKQREAIGPLPKGNGLLGVLIRDRETLRLADIHGHPGSVGFPPNHPPMKSLLGVPILFQGEAVGNLYMTEKRGAPEFDEEDQHVLELIANHAAVAITNARLYHDAKTSRDRLEVWNQQLEAEVRRRTLQIERQSHELAGRVLQAQEEERKRIARELHDETAQSLSTLLINIDLLELQLSPSEASLRAGIDRLRSLANRTLDETRALSHDLRPTILDDVGLVAAVEWFADELAQSFEGSVRVKAEEPETRLGPEIELALFRIAQEALTNAGKYSRADLVQVDLRFANGTAKLVVQDDGRGFDPSIVIGPTREGGLGLYGMRERADLIGASLDITSEIGAGTRVTVTAPTKIDRQVHTGEEQ